jgi:hypothetical protein
MCMIIVILTRSLFSSRFCKVSKACPIKWVKFKQGSIIFGSKNIHMYYDLPINKPVVKHLFVFLFKHL